MINKYIKNKFEGGQPKEDNNNIMSYLGCLGIIFATVALMMLTVFYYRRVYENYETISPALAAQLTHEKSDSTIDHSSGYAMSQTEYDIPQNALNEIYTPADE